MIKLGLTGGVGMGKSMAAELLAKRGIRIIDTDILARQVVEPGQPALVEIQQTFGSDVIDPNGQLNRKALATRVFANPAEREQLEAIVHPRIREAWQASVHGLAARGTGAVAVVIPLLYETDAAAAFDYVICVACSGSTQRKRLLARGWDESELTQRVAAQWAIEKKMQLSHFVAWTEGSIDLHAAQIDRILQRIGHSADRNVPL
jgi:dephospho-CoA kinase